MPWPGSRPSPSSSSSSSTAPSGVTARLQASRNAERRTASLLTLSQRSHDIRSLVFGGDQRSAGLLYEHAEEIQSELQRKKRTAGPVAPLSWRQQHSATLEKGKQRATSRTAPPLSLKAFRPTNLKEECLCFLLKDLAGECLLIDEVPYLPSHLKEALVNLGPKVAPLDDVSAEVLLLDGLEDGNEEGKQEADDWEAASSRRTIALPELSTVHLDLSHSMISISMLRSILIKNPISPPEKYRARLVSLRNIDLSHSKGLSLTPSLISIFSSLSLSSLSLSDVSCSLASPLEALATSLPSLKSLDISQNAWVQWEHLTHPSWDSQWTQLQRLDISGCEGLAPQKSYLDPEGKAGGPAVVVQALGIIRERGRKKWLEILA